jgi:hypothetical protein
MTRARQNAELSQGMDVASGVLTQTLFVPSDNLVNVSGTITANTGVFDLVEFNNNGDPDLEERQLAWNNSEGSLALGVSDTYAMFLGEEMHYRVRNATGSTILAGTPVYATGLTPGGNNRIEVGPYTADGNIREVRFMGLMTEDCNTGINGYTTHFGYIRAIDTRGDAASNGTTNKLWTTGEPTWNEGDILYVHPTVAGKLTKVEPQHSISVAIILNRHQNQGKLFVRSTTFGHLEDNHDVDTSGVVDGSFLVWDTGNETWQNSNNLTYLNNVLYSPKIRLPQDDGSITDGFGAYIEFGGDEISIGTSIHSISLDPGDIRIETSGNITIDSASGCYVQDNLDVIGSGDFTGDVSISGHLSASTKSFLIDHPTKKNKKLQYGSLESPYHGVRLTGRDKIVDGFCSVKLPGYMKKLVQEEDINIQITNYKHGKTLYVDSIDLEKNIFTVKGYRCKSAGELEFFWSFTAIRKDVPELIVEK